MMKVPCFSSTMPLNKWERISSFLTYRDGLLTRELHRFWWRTIMTSGHSFFWALTKTRCKFFLLKFKTNEQKWDTFHHHHDGLLVPSLMAYFYAIQIGCRIRLDSVSTTSHVVIRLFSLQHVLSSISVKSFFV